MSNTELINKLKNPELRKGDENLNHPSGNAFSELSISEMNNVYGAANEGEVSPMSTFVCGALISYVGTRLVSSNFKC